MPEPRESREAFAGSVIKVFVEDWPGRGPYEVVKHPGSAAVLPITADDHVLLVKQFRPAIRQELTEIPAGLLDVRGEDALTCAARELFEETGYRHTAIEFLAGYYASAGFADEYFHLFWARTAAEPEAPPEEGIELLKMPLETMIAAARAGKVRDVKTALALSMIAGRPLLA